jgi:hypothetical protein
MVSMQHCFHHFADSQLLHGYTLALLGHIYM